MSELKKAIEPLDQHDACDDCGKRSDGLMICTYVHDDTTTKLCPTCIKDSGFCLRCGYYSAGCSSFDFSDMPGYCSECKHEIKAEFADDDDDEIEDGFSIDEDLLDEFADGVRGSRSVLDQGLPSRKFIDDETDDLSWDEEDSDEDYEP